MSDDKFMAGEVFARLYRRESDGAQLLAMKDKDADKLPAIAFRFKTPKDNTCVIHLSFGTVEERDGAFNAPNLGDMGWDLVEEVNRESGL